MVLVVFAAGAASAKLCGDDVDGQDVPCACGDIVVSDLVLDDDPVADTVCDGNGLVIRAGAARGVRIDLAGRTLRGSGVGEGLQVLFGGEGGARVVSGSDRATIAGFENGVVASGGELSLIENVLIRDAVRDGLRARSRGLTVRGCVVEGSGRDGFAFSGRSYLSVDNQSRANKRHGFMLMGQAGDLTRSSAVGNGSAGFMVTGSGHEFVGCIASTSGKNGMEVVAAGLSIRGCRAEHNGASGIEGHGAKWRLADNTATGNGEHGVYARGSGMIDEGGNKGVGNGFVLDGEVRDCAIGGTDCGEGPSSAGDEPG